MRVLIVLVCLVMLMGCSRYSDDCRRSDVGGVGNRYAWVK